MVDSVDDVILNIESILFFVSTINEVSNLVTALSLVSSPIQEFSILKNININSICLFLYHIMEGPQSHRLMVVEPVNFVVFK